MAYKYNPLIPLNLQKQDPAATPGDIDRLQEEIDTLTADMRNKVPKISKTIEEIEIGEIGEYQGVTNETFTEGYFYKRNNALPVVYEDVTIPSGSQRIIYTNKFDSSQKVVYAIEESTLGNEVVVNYSQSGSVYSLTSEVHDNINTKTFYQWNLSNETSLISGDRGVFFGLQSILTSMYNTIIDDQSINGVKSLYDWLSSISLSAGFLPDNSQPAKIGRIDDVLFNMYIPVILKNGASIQRTDVWHFVLMSDLVALNWDYEAYISNWYPITIEEGVWCYDAENYNRLSFQYNAFGFSVGDFKYLAIQSGGSGQRCDAVYSAVSSDGAIERYIDTNHLLCVFDSEPQPESTLWAQAIDLDLYFNYTASIETTTETITIHKKKQYYDEYGFPLVQTDAITRVDTQPSLNPADFATATQGEHADSALQTITASGTGYLSLTASAKSGDAGAKTQSVSGSLTMQPLSTADGSHQGLAESSDVKSYIADNTATKAQGTAASTALQQVEHGTDGLYVSTTVTPKSSNKQTIYTALTLQDVETADDTHKGVAEASNVRKMFNIIATTSEAYGVMWDTANPSPTLTRIGNMTNHVLLPVQSQMIGGVMADDGTFTPFDNQADWTQATQARDGSDGQVMVRIPRHWRRCSTFGTYNIVMLSPVEIPGYVEVREQYVSAYEASLQRSTLKLSSVNNATADYRGGQNEASWDGTYRTLLNRPVSNIDLTEFRTYARNRAAGTSWNCLTYEAVRTIFWLFAVEYATLNSQADYTSELDANGYHQGGLGIGVSDWNGDTWNSFNGYAPLLPCGVLDEYGSGTATKNFSIYNADTTLAHTFQCNKYRGIEMPFGHLWKHTDGVLINVEANPGVSTAYVTTDTAYFSSTSIADYSAICNTYRVDSYIKGIVFNADGDIFSTTSGGNSTSYYCDHYWGANIPSSGSQLRAWLFGGRATYGFNCGLACARSSYVPGVRNRDIGSRLCFVP